MQLGLVTYMWGADWDLPTLISNCAETGFRGVELRTGHKHGVETSLSAAERREVAARFADSPVTLVGLGTTCEFHSADADEVAKNVAEAKAAVQLCHDCGGSGIKVRPNGLPMSVSVSKTLEQIGRSLAEVARFGEGLGIVVRLEVHGRGTSELPHVRTIMDAADHPGAVVCWNSNPTDLAGEGLEHNFNLVKDRLGTIHIHELISEYPWQQLFALLKQSGFDGWTLLEEGNATADPLRVMKYYRLLWERMTA
ncbi:MAG: sugar phosphate isomerase/epimerase [Pirellulales bacterium]|nr:sugar phosphate isomerase/epimerase [Pirellulales bacterium]